MVHRHRPTALPLNSLREGGREREIKRRGKEEGGGREGREGRMDG